MSKQDKRDILIQDKGNNVALVVPQTEKAKVVFNKDKAIKDKAGFEIEANQAIQILTWAITHNLSVDSKVPMVINSKKK